ncbi:nitrite reductase small subunit NirD [Streptomyces sp. NPDC090306]|uniref:nitrite reductase small subunit NirD n=1 Tax=Streptomyces sp. NPDC090306 TaxID=3365961 RepID=UPI00382FACE5
MTPVPETAAPRTDAHTTGTGTGTGPRVQLLLEGGWLDVCSPEALLPGRGVAALLPDGSQAALFRDRAGLLYAIGNRDPFTGAAVLSRGLTGTHEGRPFVASPLLKQRFDLRSGQCLDDPAVRVETYEVRAARAVPPAPAQPSSAS